MRPETRSFEVFVVIHRPTALIPRFWMECVSAKTGKPVSTAFARRRRCALILPAVTNPSVFGEWLIGLLNGDGVA
jgi:hypothetical protein